MVFAPLDVRNDASVASFFGALERLDVLVNCAGSIQRRQENDPVAFALVIDISLTGSMRTCAEARGLLKAQSLDYLRHSTICRIWDNSSSRPLQ